MKNSASASCTSLLLAVMLLGFERCGAPQPCPTAKEEEETRMSSRPLPVTVAAILLVLLSLFNFPWVYEIFFPGAEGTGRAPLLGVCGRRCGPRRRRRIVDAQTMELLEHHRCLCAQLPFGSAGSSLCGRRRTECCYRSNGGSGYAHHRFGSASRLSAGFGRCRTTFARKVSRVSENAPSRILRE